MNLLRQKPAQMASSQPEGTAQPQEAAGHGLPVAGSEQSLFQLDLGRALEMHRKLAVGIMLAGLLAAGVYLKKMWPIYTAQSLVYVQPTPASVLEGAIHARWPYNYDPTSYESYIQQQILSMTRQDVLESAVKKLTALNKIKPGESDKAAAARLKGSVEVARVGASYQVSITAHASDAETAAVIANTVAQTYIESTSDVQRALDAQRSAILREERDRVAKELEADRNEQAALNAQLGVAAIGPVAPQHLDDDIGKLHDELTKARTARDEAAAKVTALGANAPSSAALDAEAEEVAGADPGLASLKQALDQRRAALVTQMANLTPNHPQYKQSSAELAGIDASLDKESKDLRAKAAARLQQKMRSDLARTAEVENRLNAQLGGLTHAAAGVTVKLQRASDLSQDITRLQQRGTTVDEQLRNLVLEESAPGTAYLSTPATPPAYPFFTGVMRNVLVIAFGGIFLGLAAAVVAHKLDPRIYIASDIEQVVGIPPLAVLPDFLEVSDAAGEEHMLRLASGLEYAHQQGGMKNCIFTGAAPGTGVTTLATRARTMLETLGKQTVLVDASGTTPLDNGAADNDSSSSAEMTPEEAGDESLVITDAAPLAVSAETEYLARLMDGAIVVVESGVTTRAQLKNVARTLERLNVTSVGFVLNRVQMHNADRAFRRQVKAMEQHLRTQSQTLASRMERSRPAVKPAAERNQQLQAQAAPAAVAPPQPAQASLPIARPVDEPLPWTAPATQQTAETKFATDNDAATQIRRNAPVAAEIASGLAHEKMPDWIADAATQTADGEYGKPREPKRETSFAAAPPPVEPVAVAPQVEPKTPAPRPAARPAEEIKPQDVRAEQPAQSWERVTPQEPAQKAAAAPPASWQTEESRGSEAEPERAADPAARLSGLRNLLFSLGLKKLNSARGTQRDFEAEEEPAPAPREPEERRVYAQPPRPQAVTPGERNATTARIVAQPEFLPPRPQAEPPQDEQPTGSRAGAWEEYEDVQILPSKRGQYKRK